MIKVLHLQLLFIFLKKSCETVYLFFFFFFFFFYHWLFRNSFFCSCFFPLLLMVCSDFFPLLLMACSDFFSIYWSSLLLLLPVPLPPCALCALYPALAPVTPGMVFMYISLWPPSIFCFLVRSPAAPPKINQNKYGIKFQTQKSISSKRQQLKTNPRWAS